MGRGHGGEWGSVGGWWKGVEAVAFYYRGGGGFGGRCLFVAHGGEELGRIRMRLVGVMSKRGVWIVVEFRVRVWS